MRAIEAWYQFVGVRPTALRRRSVSHLQRTRARALKLVLSGLSRAEAARRIGVSASAVKKWMRFYRMYGRSRVTTIGRSGKRPRLSRQQWERLVEWLRVQGQGKRHPYTLRQIADIIRERYGVEYNHRYIERPLRDHGYITIRDRAWRR